MKLYALPLDGGPAEQIGSIPKLQGTGIGRWETQFTVSPDDAAIIWTLAESQEVDLEVLRSILDDSAFRLLGLSLTRALGWTSAALDESPAD